MINGESGGTVPLCPCKAQCQKAGVVLLSCGGGETSCVWLLLIRKLEIFSSVPKIICNIQVRKRESLLVLITSYFPLLSANNLYIEFREEDFLLFEAMWHIL